LITAVNGKVSRIGTDWVDIDLGAVSVRVNIPTSTVDQVGAPGAPIRLFTSMQVREDSLTLYGFASEDSKRSFESLLGINGVGPRLALSVLSMFSPEDLAAAVASEDVAGFSKVPGVGKKTAGRIVLELKGQLNPEWEVSAQGGGMGDVLEALTALGYSLIEAREAAANLPSNAGATTEERVRAALDRLGGR
jgi:Holliday junction DNA helicase RuvA